MTRTTYTTPEGRVTRDAILDAAIRAFAARGYRGASIDSIAAEVGVSRQGVLHHFPSKVKLLVAVLQRRDEEDAKVAAEMFERHGSLVDAFDAWRQYRADRLGLAQLYTVLSAESVDPQHPAHDYFVERYRTLRTRLVADITDLQADGRLTHALSPETLAGLFIAIMDGLQLQQQLDGDSLDADTVLVDLLRALGLAQS
jgi:AcrR family transcriptional regulator